MEETLTRKQVQVLEFIRDFRARSGYSPTLREIATELGVSSVATVAEHVASLDAKGLLRRRPDRARCCSPPGGAPSSTGARPGGRPSRRAA
jgi:repressor LexA